MKYLALIFYFFTHELLLHPSLNAKTNSDAINPTKRLQHAPCSQVVIFKENEVVVDPTAETKGEGIRYIIQENSEAVTYLNAYQKEKSDGLYRKFFGPAGALLILSGVFWNPDDQMGSISTRKALFIGGGSLLLFAFLLTKTSNQEAEKLLDRAIDTYNEKAVDPIRPFARGPEPVKQQWLSLSYSFQF